MRTAGPHRRLDGEDLHRRELYIERYAGPTLTTPVTAQQEEEPPRLYSKLLRFLLLLR